MTVQEAIDWLKAISVTLQENIHKSSYLKRKEAIHIGIQALRELEQYRALGTVEELKEAREKQVEKQPKTDWIPCEVGDLIDKVFSHNEIVALWIAEETEDVRYDKLIWRGMAWKIPKVYRGCKFLKIFGTVPESIVEADTINIRIEFPQPYKKEGAENVNT